MAPEVMLYSSATEDCYSFSADIWSVGCVVIEMWTGMRPWWPLDPPQISYKLCVDKEAKPAYPNQIAEEAVKFLDRCIQYEADKRDTAEQLQSHSFLKIQM
jgi:serine/threonine protein kinase